MTMKEKNELFHEKITIKFDNNKPVEVIDFLTSISAFQKEYEDTIKQLKFKVNNDDLKLYINVREGSIVWEFARIIAEKSVDIVQERILNKVYDTITGIFKKVENEDSITEDTITSLKNTKNVFQPATKDLPSKFSIEYENQTEKLNFNFQTTGSISRGVCEELKDIIKTLQKPQNDEFMDEVLQLVISSKPNTTSIRGIIDLFDNKDYQIAFADDTIKDIILNSKKTPFLQYYLVSGTVKRAQDKIVLYYITKMEEIEVKD